MNFLTYCLHVLGNGASAYITARHLCDPLTRPTLLAGFHLAEAGSVPFLEALSDRAKAEGDLWLADQLARHASDERRHGQIFAHGLKQHNKQLIDFKSIPEKQPNGEADDRRRSPFFEAYFEGHTPERMKPDRIDWIDFMGSTYILELDASKDFVRMANVLSETQPLTASLKKGILSVAQDETRHAAYLYEALERRLSPVQVTEVIDIWRTRKVNALFAMVGGLLKRGGQMPSLVQDGVPSEMTDTVETQTPEVVMA
ncbi:MAG: ferritin-like domain-containing protein [Leptolyngbyaceae cyanobacterium bins.59]|nr:ferritin-like domain-containing protein [Leptolyngbyaceae cyanobacterium bins.59]